MGTLIETAGDNGALEYEPTTVDVGVVVVASEQPVVRSIALHVGFSPEKVQVDQSWRRIYGVVLGGNGVLRAVAFAPNRSVFEGLPVLERHDPQLLTVLRELDAGLDEVPEPYEMATVKLVDFPSEAGQIIPPETKETLKLMQIIRTPTRDSINLRHQLQLWGRMAEIMSRKMTENSWRMRRLNPVVNDEIAF